MNKQQRILSALNYAALVVCIFFVVFLFSLDRTEHIGFFIAALLVFIVNSWLIWNNRKRLSYIIFSLCCNFLILIFDAGYDNPTASYVFYFPLLFSHYILTERSQRTERFLLMFLSIVCILLTNFTDLTPKFALNLQIYAQVRYVAVFNITVSLLSSMYIFWSYVQGYKEAEEIITAEKDKLFYSTQLLNSINQNIDVGLCRTSKENDRLIYANRAYVEMFGYADETEALATRPVFTYYDPDDRLKAMIELERKGEVKNMEIRYRKKCGSVFWALLSSVKVEDADGRVSYDGAIRDITHLKKIEEELIQAKVMAEQASSEKSRFLSTMSHEIRTPMNAVIAISNLLIRDEPKESQMDSLSLLKFSAENLLLLLNNILDFSKIEAGMVEMELLPVNISRLASDVMKMYEPQTMLKDMELCVEDSTRPEALYMIDPVRLTQILNNLVSNAVKFTDVGTVILRIEEKESTEEESVLSFSVEDTGIGIEKDRIEKVFESFTQENSSVSRKFGGSGLGLNITRRLVELMGSSLHAESEKGKGSRFYFDLRLTRAMAVPEDLTPGVTKRYVDGMKVLLVEDNISSIAVAKKYLESWSLEFDIADSGDAAIRLVSENEYDIILMDLHMPGLDGYETTKKIREFNKIIPIIALTADAFSEARTRSLSIGMNDFISKPFKSEELYDKLALYNFNSMKS